MPMINSSLVGSKIAATMGIKIPKVPQDVPVANASTQATTKIIAGRKLARPAAAESIRLPTNTSAPNMPVIFFKEVARVRIKMAGTIAMKPFGRPAAMRHTTGQPTKSSSISTAPDFSHMPLMQYP